MKKNIFKYLAMLMAFILMLGMCACRQDVSDEDDDDDDDKKDKTYISCGDCGEKNKESASFCASCGAALIGGNDRVTSTEDGESSFAEGIPQPSTRDEDHVSTPEWPTSPEESESPNSGSFEGEEDVFDEETGAVTGAAVCNECAAEGLDDCRGHACVVCEGKGYKVCSGCGGDGIMGGGMVCFGCQGSGKTECFNYCEDGLMYYR